MDETGGHHTSEISLTWKEKFCMISLICGSKKAKHLVKESRMVVTKGRSWGKWGDAGQRVQSHNYVR